ncbi:CBS domain-containing protein [Aureivirga sp. CE67]|uniref:CBS domain-containing protein n=1 Tax=Aureivirga sp. CE67 TaxID=1788983 RepID=UPI0018C8E428|nr:CBS domain-containing protein [Aureivirga sp. CE67]
MSISDYITTDFPAISEEETIQDLIFAIEGTNYTHYPVTRAGIYHGAIPINDILLEKSTSKKIKEFEHLIVPFFAEENTKVVDLLKMYSTYDTNVIPVVNSQREFIGSFEVLEIIHLLNELPYFQEEGDILVVEKNIKDFSFSEISQIVESNNGKILGMLVSKIKSEKIQVSIRLVSHDINEIIQTFRRYDYFLISKHDDDLLLESLRDRSNYLKKYLNI